MKKEIKKLINVLDIDQSVNDIYKLFVNSKLWTSFYLGIFISALIFIVCVQSNVISDLENTQCRNNTDSLISVGADLAVDSVTQYYASDYCIDSMHNYWVAHKHLLNHINLPK